VGSGSRPATCRWRGHGVRGSVGGERERPTGTLGWPGDGGSISATNRRKEGPVGQLAMRAGHGGDGGSLASTASRCSQRGLRLRGEGGSLVRRRRSRLKQSVHGRVPTADFAGGAVVFQQPSPLPHAPPLLPTLAVQLLRPLLPEQAPAAACEAPGGAAASAAGSMSRGSPPTSPGLRRPRSGAGWRRHFPARSCPIRRSFFYCRRGPISCQRIDPRFVL